MNVSKGIELLLIPAVAPLLGCAMGCVLFRTALRWRFGSAGDPSDLAQLSFEFLMCLALAVGGPTLLALLFWQRPLGVFIGAVLGVCFAAKRHLRASEGKPNGPLQPL